MAQAIDLIVMQEQLIDGQRKVTHITEVQSVSSDGDVVLRDLFSYEIQGMDENTKGVVGRWRVNGVVPDFFPRFAMSGIPFSQDIFKEE
jgi:pilus assembly protein CpaF